MKNALLFICSTNILVRLLTVNMKNCLTPNNPKMCDPIVVTLLKMRPHNSQSGRENATPSSDTSPLASYKKWKKSAKKKKKKKKERKCDCRCHNDTCIPVHISLVIYVSPTPRSSKQVSILFLLFFCEFCESSSRELQMIQDYEQHIDKRETIWDKIIAKK